MITDKELKKLQTLSKLKLEDDNLKDFSVKLGTVIDMIDQLQEVDCDGVEPLRSVCDMDQRMRLDEVKNADISDDLFKNIPEQGSSIAKEVKYFIVPKVIE